MKIVFSNVVWKHYVKLNQAYLLKFVYFLCVALGARDGLYYQLKQCKFKKINHSKVDFHATRRYVSKCASVFKKLLTLPQWVKRVCWAKLPLLLNKQMHQLLNKRPKYKSQLKIMKNSEINSDHLYTIYLTWWGRLRGWSCKGQTFTFFETKHLTNATLKHLERFFIINYASIFVLT